jgi:hypothetical protein
LGGGAKFGDVVALDDWHMSNIADLKQTFGESTAGTCLLTGK